MSTHYENQNIVDFQFYKNHKESKNKTLIDTILQNKLPYNCLAYSDENEVQTRVQNIHTSIKRINTLISELNKRQNKPRF